MTTVDKPEIGGELEVRAIASERLTFFVDAVIAIAITLLALDLPLPTGKTNGDVLRSILHQRDEYLAFAISFMVIASHWRGHHRVFRYVRYLDGRLTGLSFAWLFMQVATPFATRVLTGDGAFQARFGLYALVQVVAMTLFVLMVREIDRQKLCRPDVPKNLLRETTARTTLMAIGFAVSIPVSFLTGWAYVCWAAGPVLAKLYRRLRHISATND